MLETILKDEEIKAIINNVNNVIIVNNCGCHGMGHITRVMNHIKTILVGIGCAYYHSFLLFKSTILSSNCSHI